MAQVKTVTVDYMKLKTFIMSSNQISEKRADDLIEELCSIGIIEPK